MVNYLVFLTILIGIYVLFSLGLNLQWGFTGLINFGHIGFMTIGAYTTVVLSKKGFPLILSVIMGMGLAALLGLLIGISTLKLREDYLGIVTIGVSELLRLIANNEEWLTNGPSGVQSYPLPLEDLDPNFISKLIMIVLLNAISLFALWLLWSSFKKQWQENKEIEKKSYQPRKPLSIIIFGVIGVALVLLVDINGTIAIFNYNYKVGLMLLNLLILTIVYIALELLVNSPWGRILKAIREDEEIPKALGKNVFWYKLQAFMLGGGIAGLAGSFYAWQLTTVFPTNFEPLITFNAWTMIMLGGAGSNAGSILGVIIFWAYDSLTRFVIPQLEIINIAQLGAFRGMTIGLILMLLMIWRPQGILGRKEELSLGR